MIDSRTLGRLLAANRRLHGLRQEDLARRVRVSTDHLSHIERGARRPSAGLLARIVIELGVPAPRAGEKKS